jgi:hypothetical protein
MRAILPIACIAVVPALRVRPSTVSTHDADLRDLPGLAARVASPFEGLLCDLDAFAEWHIGHALPEFPGVAMDGPQHGERRLVAKIAAVDVKVRDVDRSSDIELVLLEPCERRGELGAASADRFEFDQVAGQERVDTN